MGPKLKVFLLCASHQRHYQKQMTTNVPISPYPNILAPVFNESHSLEATQL
jgi:hypothetical protein